MRAYELYEAFCNLQVGSVKQFWGRLWRKKTARIHVSSMAIPDGDGGEGYRAST
jgi:hypothetical protein